MQTMNEKEKSNILSVLIKFARQPSQINTLKTYLNTPSVYAMLNSADLIAIAENNKTIWELILANPNLLKVIDERVLFHLKDRRELAEVLLISAATYPALKAKIDQLSVRINFLNLPAMQNIFGNIARFLDVRSLGRLSQTSTQYRAKAQEEAIWREKLAMLFKEITGEQITSVIQATDIKRIYKNLHSFHLKFNTQKPSGLDIIDLMKSDLDVAKLVLKTRRYIVRMYNMPEKITLSEIFKKMGSDLLRTIIKENPALLLLEEMNQGFIFIGNLYPELWSEILGSKVLSNKMPVEQLQLIFLISLEARKLIMNDAALSDRLKNSTFKNIQEKGIHEIRSVYTVILVKLGRIQQASAVQQGASFTQAECYQAVIEVLSTQHFASGLNRLELINIAYTEPSVIEVIIGTPFMVDKLNIEDLKVCKIFRPDLQNEIDSLIQQKEMNEASLGKVSSSSNVPQKRIIRKSVASNDNSQEKTVAYSKKEMISKLEDLGFFGETEELKRQLARPEIQSMLDADSITTIARWNEEIWTYVLNNPDFFSKLDDSVISHIAPEKKLVKILLASPAVDLLTVKQLEEILFFQEGLAEKIKEIIVNREKIEKEQSDIKDNVRREQIFSDLGILEAVNKGDFDSVKLFLEKCQPQKLTGKDLYELFKLDKSIAQYILDNKILSFRLGALLSSGELHDLHNYHQEAFWDRMVVLMEQKMAKEFEQAMNFVPIGSEEKQSKEKEPEKKEKGGLEEGLQGSKGFFNSTNKLEKPIVVPQKQTQNVKAEVDSTTTLFGQLKVTAESVVPQNAPKPANQNNNVSNANDTVQPEDRVKHVLGVISTWSEVDMDYLKQLIKEEPKVAEKILDSDELRSQLQSSQLCKLADFDHDIGKFILKTYSLSIKIDKDDAFELGKSDKSLAQLVMKNFKSELDTDQKGELLNVIRGKVPSKSM